MGGLRRECLWLLLLGIVEGLKMERSLRDEFSAPIGRHWHGVGVCVKISVVTISVLEFHKF
jgi:hypothetical protein